MQQQYDGGQSSLRSFDDQPYSTPIRLVENDNTEDEEEDNMGEASQSHIPDQQYEPHHTQLRRGNRVRKPTKCGTHGRLIGHK